MDKLDREELSSDRCFHCDLAGVPNAVRFLGLLPQPGQCFPDVVDAFQSVVGAFDFVRSAHLRP